MKYVLLTPCIFVSGELTGSLKNEHAVHYHNWFSRYMDHINEMDIFEVWWIWFYISFLAWKMGHGFCMGMSYSWYAIGCGPH